MVSICLVNRLKNYYQFDNVTRNAEEALNDTLLFGYEYQEANNYCREDFDIANEKIDEFEDSKKKFDDLKKKIIAPYELPSSDSF